MFATFCLVAGLSVQTEVRSSANITLFILVLRWHPSGPMSIDYGYDRPQNVSYYIHQPETITYSFFQSCWYTKKNFRLSQRTEDLSTFPYLSSNIVSSRHALDQERNCSRSYRWCFRKWFQTSIGRRPNTGKLYYWEFFWKYVTKLKWLLISIFNFNLTSESKFCRNNAKYIMCYIPFTEASTACDLVWLPQVEVKAWPSCNMYCMMEAMLVNVL